MYRGSSGYVRPTPTATTLTTTGEASGTPTSVEGDAILDKRFAVIAGSQGGGSGPLEPLPKRMLSKAESRPDLHVSVVPRTSHREEVVQAGEEALEEDSFALGRRPASPQSFRHPATASQTSQ